MENLIDLTSKYTRTDYNRLNKHLVSWTTVQPFIGKLSFELKSLVELRKMITIEIDNNCRAQILERLIGRYRTIRLELETELIFTITTNKLKISKERLTKNRPAIKKKQQVPVQLSLGDELVNARE